MNMTYTIHTIFDNGTVKVEHFDCPGLCQHTEKPAEECALNHEIVLPRYGVFQRYDAFGRMITDVNHLLFFNRNQPYQITHPRPGKDASTIITLADSHLMAAIAPFDASVEERIGRPFLTGYTLLDPRQQLEKHRLLQVLASVQSFDPLAIEEVILLFVHDIFATPYAEHAADISKKHQDTVQQVQQFLNEHYCNPLSLATIASAVHYSSFTLCRIFKQNTGLTIHQYLTRLRLSVALEWLMAEPQQAIGEIGIQLGFYSHSHFTAAFSQAFAISPSAFRQQASTTALRNLRKNLKATRDPYRLS
jgi:AraC-like DNA-binding protein